MPMIDYETKESEAAEQEVAGVILEMSRCGAFKKLSVNYSLDFAFLVGVRKIKAFVEVKSRPNMPFGYGTGYWLGLSKAMRGRQINLETGLPCFLALRLSDGRIYITDLFNHEPGAIWAGREDRPEDKKAIEPHVVYPWSGFKPVEELFKKAIKP